MTDFIDKRKNFRFPAFDDDEGVKLEKNHTRVLFAEEYDPQRARQTTGVRENATYAEKYYPEETEPSTRKDYLEPLREVTMGQKKTTPYENEGYQPPLKKNNRGRLVEKPVFKSDYQPSVEKKNKEPEETQTIPRKREYSPSSHKRFTPKSIPPSYSREEKGDAQQIAELYNQMVKPKDSYLLMDVSTAKTTANSVEGKEGINFKHRQTQTGDDLEMHEWGDQAEKKNSSHRLEKSLSGIMAEEEKQLNKNKYFH